MNCPKCNSTNVVMVGELARCNACEYYYKPATPPAAAQNDVMVQPVMLYQLPETRAARAALRRRADSFERISTVCAAIGILGLLFGFGGGQVLLIIGAASFTLAFWFYFVAQIVHIRANTEK